MTSQKTILRHFITFVKHHQLKGFSLAEVSISLIIMGVLVAGALKGHQLLRTARLSTTADQFRAYEIGLSQYQDAYGTLPGLHQNGSVTDQHTLWQALFRFLQQETLEGSSPKSKSGGHFKVVHNFPGLPGHWLVLSADENHTGVVSPAEARTLLTKYGESSPVQGRMRVLNGQGSTDCLEGNTLNLGHSQKSCIIAVDLRL